MKSFIRFLLVGGLGYLIDVGLTYALLTLSVNPYLARVPAVIVAMVVTWRINRRVVFRSSQDASVNEFLRYMGVALVVATLNYGAYMLLVYWRWLPIIAITFTAGCQAFISYFLYRVVVFHGVPND